MTEDGRDLGDVVEAGVEPQVADHSPDQIGGVAGGCEPASDGLGLREHGVQMGEGHGVVTSGPVPEVPGELDDLDTRPTRRGGLGPEAVAGEHG